MRAIVRTLCPLATLIAVVFTAALAHAQYQPIPVPTTPAGLNGPAFGAAIDQRFNGTVPIYPTGPLYDFGNQSSGTFTCPVGYKACSITLNGDNSVTPDIATPADTALAQTVQWQINQDCPTSPCDAAHNHAGHFLAGWGGNETFQNLEGVPVVNTTWNQIGRSETFTFEWNPNASKWALQSRSANTAANEATSQGNSDAIGNIAGNASSPTTFPIPANQWVGIIGDNGGFEHDEGGGVYTFLYGAWGWATICNTNPEPEVFSTYCEFSGYSRRPDTDRPIEGYDCKDYSYNGLNTVSPAPTTYGSHICYVNASAPMTLLHSNEFSLEIPVE